MTEPLPVASPTAPAAVSRWIVVRFLILFGALFGLLLWILDGTGPVAGLNAAINRITLLQARAAAGLLRWVGQEVSASGASLDGPGFACTVDTGCNGMSAVVLMAAGLLSFPVPFRFRALGVLLLPLILLINVIRIAGLYWTGVHAPDWFGSAHVYGGQVLVILLTMFLWLGWLTWASSTRGRS